MKVRCHNGGKVRYPTFRDAQLALIDIILYVNIYGDDPRKESHIRKTAKRKERRIHPCPSCHGYHLTSQPYRPAKNQEGKP